LRARLRASSPRRARLPAMGQACARGPSFPQRGGLAIGSPVAYMLVSVAEAPVESA
jgi:hypothetical protein